jgi:hypothetical protein
MDIHSYNRALFNGRLYPVVEASLVPFLNPAGFVGRISRWGVREDPFFLLSLSLSLFLLAYAYIIS